MLEALYDLASSNHDVMLLTADLGYGVIPKYFHRFGIKDMYTTIVGSQSYLRGESGILSDNIVNFIRKCFL